MHTIYQLKQDLLQDRECFGIRTKNVRLYRHSSIYAVNVGTQKKKMQKQKPCKSRLLSSTKGEESRIES